MSKFLRKSFSMDNIFYPKILNPNPNAPIYTQRNPQRDELGDAQSLIDRSSVAQSSRQEETIYDNENISNTQPSTIQPGLKPTQPAINIESFDPNDEMSITAWFRKYERMAAANNWSDEVKAAHLFFNISEEPQRYLDNLTKNFSLPYNVIKEKLIKKYTSRLQSTFDLEKIMNREFKIGQETFDSYFFDKLQLLENFDPNMTYESQSQYILSGLNGLIYTSVLLGMQKNPPQNIDELKDHIEFVIRVHDGNGMEGMPFD